jgi:hypothetical protein
MSKRKPHNHIRGYVCELRNRLTGIGYVVVYDRNKGFDCDADGRYVVVCETHFVMVSATSLPRARAAMKAVDFCEECREYAEKELS